MLLYDVPSRCGRIREKSREGIPELDFLNSWKTGIRGPVMLTKMTGRLCWRCSTPRSRSEVNPGRDDRKFLEALHYFTVHSITWRALPAEFDNWNSIWKQYWRLSRTGVFEAFLQLLAETGKTAHAVQVSITRWYTRMSPARVPKRKENQALGRSRGGSARKSSSRQTLMACPLPSV